MYDVIVIGGGQAGLTAGYFLKQQGLDYLILDDGKSVGDSWRRRFQSLRLFTPNNLNRLAGSETPRGEGEYLTKDEFADYLAAYAGQHSLNVQLNSKVIQLDKQSDRFLVKVAYKGSIQHVVAQQVIIATGAFATPIIPEFAERVPGSILQFTVNQLAQQAFQGQRIIVVGDGASGRQIAKQYAQDNEVTLACGKARALFPSTLFGLDTFAILDKVGILNLSANTWLGRRIQARDPFPDTGLKLPLLAKLGIKLKPKLKDYRNQAVFADGSEQLPDVIIWALGYRNKFTWLNIEGAVKAGSLQQIGGTTSVKGLYSLSQPWQNNRKSALICGAESDMRNVLPTILAVKQEAPSLQFDVG